MVFLPGFLLETVRSDFSRGTVHLITDTLAIQTSALYAQGQVCVFLFMRRPVHSLVCCFVGKSSNTPH